MSEKLRAVFHACVPRRIASAIRNLRQTLHLYKDSILQAYRYNRNYSRVASTELTQLENTNHVPEPSDRKRTQP